MLDQVAKRLLARLDVIEHDDERPLCFAACSSVLVSERPRRSPPPMP